MQTPAVFDLALSKNDAVPVASTVIFPVVGVCSSAGGLQASIKFFENLPAEPDMAFVVVMHLSPTHESSVSQVLQRATRMPVTEVKQRTRLENNHVYVVSPSLQLSMDDGHLDVADSTEPNHRISIDIFLRSLADVHRQRSFGILLSGMGADGGAGFARLKEQGGVTLAQLPDDAEHGEMPAAAIAAGVVDFVLPVVEIPQKLLDLWQNARRIRLPPIVDTDESTVVTTKREAANDDEAVLGEVVNLLRSRTGHDFRHYKRATVLRRIERRLQVRAVPDLHAYRQMLKEDRGESGALLSDMLIGVTQFFRDREAFEALERDVLPAIFRGKDASEEVRVWTAACSSGEEAYSLAMLLKEQAELSSSPPELQVFATDIDDRAVAFARSGLYPQAVRHDLSPTRLREHFTVENAHYRIKKSIRDVVLFASQNLLHDPPFSRLDLICCRNLLIYLNRDIHAKVLEIFHYALKPNGYLFLGNSESADALPDFFTPVDKKNRIYRATGLPRSGRLTHLMPALPVSERTPSAVAVATERKKWSFADVHQKVLVDCAPPSLLVNHQSDIVHVSEGAGRFLRYVAGEPSRSLMAVIEPDLRLEVRTAIFHAIQSGKVVETARLTMEREGKAISLKISATPFHNDAAAADLVLILFNEVDDHGGQPAGRSADGQQNSILAALESDLQRTKAQLQETIEHSETSTEELKASNEELQAINEELRSATEELETSKEELQSVNEELITVNQELKNKVDETSKSNDDLQNLVTSTDIATVFVDRAMCIQRFTPRATDIFSLLPGDIGRPLQDINHKLNYDELAKDAVASFETLRIREREVSSEGGRSYIARFLPYRSSHDHIEGAILTFIDITERRLAEEALRARDERIRLVAESTKDYAIITLDAVGLITSFNLGAERIFGYSENEVLGKPADLIFTPEDRAAGMPEDEKRRAREDGRAEDERWHLRKDGSRFYCSGIMTPLQDGEFFGYAKIARDMTGRIEAERQRAEQLTQEQIRRAEAQAASKLKDEFLAIMSHELKHPLNLIHLNAEMLLRLDPIRQEPLSARAVKTIHTSAVAQAKIINDLLDQSRINTGKLTLSLSKIDLAEAVESVVDLARSDPAAKGLSITFEDAGQLPSLLADTVRIEQVIWNLLSNAIKFTPSGGHIALRLSQEGGCARLDVIDDGQGMDAQFLPRVFDMFGQGIPSTTRGTVGLGIGMALVRQIVELHGGRVEADSAGRNQGSRFSLWLPFEGACLPVPADEPASSRSLLSGLRILLVDDMADALEVFGALLEEDGAVVRTVTSGREALKVLLEQQFDLVLSDIGMPEMDGYAFVREMRKNKKLRGIPAVAITGFGRPQDEGRAREAGFNDHINKPFAIEDVLRAIEKLGVRSTGPLRGRP